MVSHGVRKVKVVALCQGCVLSDRLLCKLSVTPKESFSHVLAFRLNDGLTLRKTRGDCNSGQLHKDDTFSEKKNILYITFSILYFRFLKLRCFRI